MATSPQDPSGPSDPSQQQSAPGANTGTSGPQGTPHAEGGPPGRPPVDPSGSATPPPPPPGYQPAPQSSRRGGIFSRILTSLFTGILLASLLANVWFGIYFYQMNVGPSETVYQTGQSAERLVILPISGMIDSGTHGFVRDSLQSLRQSPPAAIILRVESGGGGVGPSDRVWKELQRFRADMKQRGNEVPIIASFGSVAASGGYYIAAPSDQIFAEPTTTTGSIGVMAPAFTIDKMLENIGVTPEIIEAPGSPKKDLANNIARPWTEADRDKLRQILDQAYEQFVDVVHQGRNDVLSEEQVREVASGEAFTAQQAKQNKLVDEIGYLADAIDAAAQAANIQDEPRVTQMRRPQGFGALGLIHADPPALSKLSAGSPREARRWLMEATAPRLMYWWGGLR